VTRTLVRSELDRASFDAIVTSVGCGWRKPHPKAFETVAGELGVEPETLIHVGDDPATDGGVEDVGGTFRDVNDTDLDALATELQCESPGDGSRGGEECR